MSLEPYHRSPVFDETNLPTSLLREHRTKEKVWGLVRVLSGQVRLRIFEPPSDHILSPEKPGLLLPDQAHALELLGPVQLQVEFYEAPPELTES